MAPIEVKTKKEKQMMQVDEHPRPQTTMEQLQKLPPVFKKDGTVTAGNASVCHISLPIFSCQMIVKSLPDTSRNF